MVAKRTVLAFLLPEGKEGVNGVNYLVDAMRVRVQNLRVAIDAYHGHAAEKTYPEISGSSLNSPR